jgi:transposase
MTAAAPVQPTFSAGEEIDRLRREKEQWGIEKRILELKIDKLQRQLWDKKSERLPRDEDADRQKLLFSAPATPQLASESPAAAMTERISGPHKPATPRGPKPLDPALPREVIALPAPDLNDLICPVTRRPMQPGFVEHLEVLARRAPEYYVKRYERTVFVSPAKSAPVYAPWPTDVLPRARVHASVVAHVAAAHYCEHLPFYRIEQQLARTGVELPRNCQVSLMEQLERLATPLLQALKAEIFKSDYLHLDATPIDQYDPARPGKVREATLWAYRAQSGAVWFEHAASKSPQCPDATLRAMNFRGRCQTDGAAGLDRLGVPGQVTALGCWSHARRGFFEAHQAGDPRAQWHLEHIGKLFRLERIAKTYRLSPGRQERLRQRFSVPIFQALVQQAASQAEIAPAKTALGDAVRYLLNQQEPLGRCVTTPGAELSNNAVERAVRPLKLGAKNWLCIGHPSAGPRLAHLFTLVENCRLAGIDPERYLIDIITRLADYPAAKIAELLPHCWQSGGGSGRGA